MEIDAAMVSDFVAKHHLVPLAVGLGALMKLVRPGLVDLRAGCVEVVAIFRAVAKKEFKVTDAEIEAERPPAERAIPVVPDDPGVAGKILGMATGLRDSGERKV